jgi:glutamate/tyrosine decarboxylase-like PLP-dependent enzyme
MRTKMAAQGRAREEVLSDLRSFKAGDIDWAHGRAPLFVFKGDDEAHDIGREAFFEYFSENALGAKRAFHSVRRMEEEVVDMALELFQAPESARGFMTTGGTESIIQAVQTCRDWTREQRGKPGLRGNIVAPESLHPAFDKGARLMDLEIRRAPVGPDFRADVAAMEALIDEDTMMLVGSAPCFPYGVIDPIAEIGTLAQRRGLWLHVDACVGGYLAPFARRIGRDIPDFDFSVPAVTSISADLHKFGFCPKPASTVFYRDPDRARLHAFDFNAWPNGRFTTSTIVGTRPAGGVAAAWATLQHLGVEGYERVARELMDFIDRYKAGVGAIEGLEVLGRPHLSIVAFGARELDIFAVAERLSAKGWLPGLVQRPKAIHRMMSLLHAPSLDEYLADLRDCVASVWAESSVQTNLEATY